MTPVPQPFLRKQDKGTFRDEAKVGMAVDLRRGNDGSVASLDALMAGPHISTVPRSTGCSIDYAEFLISLCVRSAGFHPAQGSDS